MLHKKLKQTNAIKGKQQPLGPVEKSVIIYKSSLIERF